ncbi:MAG: nuclear transport factor 2 family protein [Hyphomonadaceae bacterium]
MQQVNLRDTALEFLAAFIADGPAAGRRYLAPDFVWWTPRMGEIQDRIDAIQEAAARHIKGRLRLDITGVTAEGDRVAVEAVSHAELTNGRLYNNHYHFLIVFRDGKITQVKEYNDSLHAAETWAGLLS